MRGDAMQMEQGTDVEAGAEKTGTAGRFPHVSSGPEAGGAMPAQDPQVGPV